MVECGVRQAQLREDAMDVFFQRSLADEERMRNTGIRATLCHSGEDVAFSRRERVERVVESLHIDEFLDERGVDNACSGDDLRERGYELVNVAHATFQEVGGLSAGRKKFGRRFHLDMRGEDHDRGLGVALADPVRCFKTLVLVGRWHADVDDAEVGLGSFDDLDEIGRSARLPDDIEVGLFEDSCESFSQQNIVICEGDARELGCHIMDYGRD